MSVNTQISKVTRNWTGVETLFTTDMIALDPTHVIVRTATATLVLNTHYTSELAVGTNYLVIRPLPAMPAAPQVLTIERNTPALQPDDLVNTETYDANAMEIQLDRVVLVAQEAKQKSATAETNADAALVAAAAALEQVQLGPVYTVNGRGGIVVLDKTDVGLGNVDNTADAVKPVSAAQAAADAAVAAAAAADVDAEVAIINAALAGKVNTSAVGAANGVASLDASSALVLAQLKPALFAIIGKYKFSTGAYGVANNITGNTATLINQMLADAKAAAASSGGADVVIGVGGYRTTESLVLDASNVNVIFDGEAFIYPVGNFDTLKIDNDNTTDYRNSLVDLYFNEESKTGGRSIYAFKPAKMEITGKFFFGMAGFEFESFNDIKFDAKIEGYRGTSGQFLRLVGGRDLGAGVYNPASDQFDMDIVIGGTNGAGMNGVSIDGWVHTVTSRRMHAINVLGKALHTVNTVGATQNPAFLRLHNFQTDACRDESARFDAGEDMDIYFPALNRSRNETGLYIAANVKGVRTHGGTIQGHRKHGFENHGLDCKLLGTDVYANSNNEFGGALGVYLGWLLGGLSRRTTIIGVNSGRSDTSTYQAYAGQIDTGADEFTVAGCDHRFNVGSTTANAATDNINYGAAALNGTTRIMANNRKIP